MIRVQTKWSWIAAERLPVKHCRDCTDTRPGRTPTAVF